MGISKMQTEPTLNLRNLSKPLRAAYGEIAKAYGQKAYETISHTRDVVGPLFLLQLDRMTQTSFSIRDARLLVAAIENFDPLKLAFFREHISDFRAFEAALGDLAACPVALEETAVPPAVPSAADLHAQQTAAKRDEIFRHIVGDPRRVTVWGTFLPDDE